MADQCVNCRLTCLFDAWVQGRYEPTDKFTLEQYSLLLHSVLELIENSDMTKALSYCAFNLLQIVLLLDCGLLLPKFIESPIRDCEN